MQKKLPIFSELLDKMNLKLILCLDIISNNLTYSSEGFMFSIKLMHKIIQSLIYSVTLLLCGKWQ